jgi:hypothetical protein
MPLKNPCSPQIALPPQLTSGYENNTIKELAETVGGVIFAGETGEILLAKSFLMRVSQAARQGNSWIFHA